jgi:repressor LexA
MDKQPLSPRQQETLTVIKQYMDEHGLPPTIREIMASLKVAYPRGVQRHLDALEKKGYITRDPRASRGIRLVESEKPSAKGANWQAALADLADSVVRAPLLGRIPAGGPMLAEENVEDWVTLPTNLTKGKRDVFILRAQGDSMIGAGIFDGDLLVVQPTQSPQHGEIVVALIGDDATVKRFIKKDNLSYLKAENPKYDNIYPDQEWGVQGKVTAVVRPHVT